MICVTTAYCCARAISTTRPVVLEQVVYYQGRRARVRQDGGCLGSRPGRARGRDRWVFGWRPDRRYDAAFFGFWLSHVPLMRFAAFWSMVDRALERGGQVFFVNDNHRTADELIEGKSSSTIQRRLGDGTAHRVVKVPHEQKDLEERLVRLGWRITVTPTSGPFYWGVGHRA